MSVENNKKKKCQINYTNITSIIVAFILGIFNIYVIHLSNKNNIESLKIQNKFNAEISKLELEERMKQQRESLKHQENQSKKAFENSLQTIDAEKKAELTLLNQKRKIEDSEKNQKLINNLLLSINSITSELDVILNILENDNKDSFVNELFTAYSQIQLKTAVVLIKKQVGNVQSHTLENIDNKYSITTVRLKVFQNKITICIH